MIRTVIFDIGKVLIDYDWDRYIHTLFQDEELIRLQNSVIFGSGLWQEFDRGVMTDEEIIDRMVEKAPTCEKEIRLSLDRLGGCVFRLDYAIPWVREVKGLGYRVLYLSNYSKRLRDANPEVLDFLPEMDGGIFSYEVKLLKPDAAIYRAICEKYELTPAETLFLDDTAENVAGAESFGMHALQFKSYEEARKRILELN